MQSQPNLDMLRAPPTILTHIDNLQAIDRNLRHNLLEDRLQEVPGRSER